MHPVHSWPHISLQIDEVGSNLVRNQPSTVADVKQTLILVHDYEQMKIDAGADSAGAYGASLMAVWWFWCIDSGGGGGDPGASGKEICSVSAPVTASLGTTANLVMLNMHTCGWVQIQSNSTQSVDILRNTTPGTRYSVQYILHWVPWSLFQGINNNMFLSMESWQQSVILHIKWI